MSGGPIALVTVFLVNELGFMLIGRSMVYIGVRAALIPLGVAVYAALTIGQILKSRPSGREVITPVIGLVVAGAILAFQWFCSCPLFVRSH